jgi:mannosyl-oligosaccharide alpha-1,2-mannosidase
MRAMETLLVRSTPDGASGERLTFVAEMHNGVLKGKMDHLVCFVPGMLALGAQAQVVPPAEADRHMKLAAKLMHSCNEMYARTPTGLAPEIVQFELDSSVAGRADGNGAFVVDDGAAHCMLRPETVESLFVLYRVTRDPLYREWGWKIFESMRRYARIEGGGYSGLRDVRRNDRPRRPASWSNHNDKMESFALAETFKYLWLLFQPAEGIIDLDQWVLNTEAHPLPILADVDEVRTRVQQEQQQQQQQTNGNGRRLLVEQLNVLRDKSNAQKKLRQAQEEAMMAAVADAAAAAAGDAPAAVLEEPPAPALEESIQHAPPTAGEA